MLGPNAVFAVITAIDAFQKQSALKFCIAHDDIGIASVAGLPLCARSAMRTLAWRPGGIALKLRMRHAMRMCAARSDDRAAVREV